MKALGMVALGVAVLARAAPASAGFEARAEATQLQQLFAAGQPAEVSLRVPASVAGPEFIGDALLEKASGSDGCRLTVELNHQQPFEYRGVRITQFSRRSVAVGACPAITRGLGAQVDGVAQVMAQHIRSAAPAAAEAVPQAIAVAAKTVSLKAGSVAPPEPWVQAVVRERAIIRDEPSARGEKLSRVPKGTHLKLRRNGPDSDWYALDGGLRFIHASVLDLDAASDSIHLRTTEPAVIRDRPSFQGAKVAQLAAGTERRARRVEGSKGWFQLLDTHNDRALYVHESVVREHQAAHSSKADKRA